MSGVHGRDRELAAIDEALDGVVRGGQRLLVVRGEAGIGKSLLLATLAARATARRAVVLTGRATELEREVPLVPVVDALEPRIDALPDRTLRGLGSERLDRLARLFPALDVVARGVRGTAGAAATVEAGAADRWRLHRDLRDLLGVAGEGHPVALVLDDVHWADPATLELAEHLLRRPPAGGQLLVLAARPGPVADRLVGALRAGGRDAAAILDLRPLDRVAADALLAAVPDATHRDRLFRESGGNPLLLGELARAEPGRAVPGSVVDAVGAELRTLPPAARALVDAAALLGDPCDVDLAAAVAGVAHPDALAALDVLTERTLLRRTDDPRRLAFRHPVIRTAVHAAIAPGARLAAHAAAARELARTGAPLPQRAQHLVHVAATGDPVAAATLRAAAAEVRPQSPGVAADWLLAARRADPAGTGEDATALAESLLEAGRLDEALAAVDRLAPATDALRVRVATAGAGVERLLGRHDAARRRLERALADVAADGPDAARLMLSLAVAAYEGGDYETMSRWALRTDALPENDALNRATAAVLIGVGHVLHGDTDAAQEATRGVPAALDAVTDEELTGAVDLLIAAPWGLLALERLEDGLAVARRAAAAAHRAGGGPTAVGLDLGVALALRMLGRITESEVAADEATQAARTCGFAQSVQWATWMHASVLLESGDLDAALPPARESVELAERLDDSALSAVARAVLGAVLIARGDHAAGRPLVAAYDVDRGWICRWAPDLVEGDLAAGDLDAAREHAARAVAVAPTTGLGGARAAALRAQALVTLADGDHAAAAALALRAVDEATAVGAALEAARCRLLAGRALGRGGAEHRERAIAALTQASAEAAACGARRVHDEAVQELRRLGRRVGRGGPRAPGTEGLDALSPREGEIAALVAEGLTNREIGARLYLSEKTIETHLTRVYAKLGARGRAEVAARVAAADV